MKIGLLQQFKQADIDYLNDNLPNHEIIPLNISSESINDQVADLDVVIGANASSDLIASMNKLKLFHVPFVGLDRINFEALEKKKAIICNSKWNDKIVAEYSIMLLLTGIKNLIPIQADFKTGSWKLRTTPSKMLFDSSVLLIGFGSIGKEIAKLLKPFTPHVIALRNNPNQSTAEDKIFVKEIIGWEQYNKYAKEADYVINSLPLTPETTAILTKEKLLAIKKGAYYVTVGRGKTTDEQALYEILKENHLAGAAIDVWYNYKTASDNEPFYPSKFPFQELDNVIMSPHRAATFADTTPELIWNDVIFNIEALALNKPLRNVISYKKRY